MPRPVESPRVCRTRGGVPRAAILPVLLGALALAACQDDAAAPPEFRAVSTRAAAATDAELQALVDDVNVALAAQGADYMLAMAEYITADGVDEAGNTVLAKDVGNKQLGADFVPNDPRRGWSGVPGGSSDDITYAVDQTGDAVPPFGGLTGAQTTAAIQRAMSTWDDLSCSSLPVNQVADGGLDLGVIAFLFGLGGSPFIVGDIMHTGWRDINFAGGILGVTFTFVFVDGAGNPTDIDGNGKVDVAFREIYYDPSFSWANGANIDVESIALHEAGHGLSQAHFGKVFIGNDGSLKISPRAVMNALYVSPQQTLLGTDAGGHCSNWASWPNN